MMNSINRVSTGIAGVDDVLRGGLLPASSLLVGGPGTGKTVLSLRFLIEGARRGEKCLLISFGESERRVRRDAASFGWPLDGIDFEDFSGIGSGRVLAGEYKVFRSSEVEGEPVWGRLRETIAKYEPARLVIDSVSFLKFLSVDEFQYRRQLQSLLAQLSGQGCVCILLISPLELEQDATLAFAVDGVIRLERILSENRLVEIRTLEVEKFRGSGYLGGRHAMRISESGISLWPHRKESMAESGAQTGFITSGIEGVDELLGGGLPMGSSTLIAGPAGAGKTTLGVQLLASAAASGRKGAVYSFEESVGSIVQRSCALSIPLEEHIRANRILMRQVNPMEEYPDELAETVRQDIEERGVDVILLDSLRGYEMALEAFGNAVANVQNLIQMVRRLGRSLIVISEQELVTGNLQISRAGVSYVSDNILLLRLAEYRGEVIRFIVCLKKRGGAHQTAIRELKFSNEGISVGRTFEELSGLLTGVPVPGAAIQDFVHKAV